MKKQSSTKDPKATKSQRQILNYLYKFRFINTNQFQKLFNHKDPHRIKEWLKDLRDKEYINMHYSRTTFYDNTKPAVYSLAPKARRILKEEEDCNLHQLEKIYKEKKRTKKFMNYSQFITDMYIFFLSQKEKEEELNFFTEGDLGEYDYFPQPLPSAYIAVKNKENTKRYFLDYFDEYTPDWVIRRRVKQIYLTYAEEGKWEANTNDAPFPLILFIFSNEMTKRHISFYAKAILKKAYDDKLSLFLTTKDTIKFADKNITWQPV